VQAAGEYFVKRDTGGSVPYPGAQISGHEGKKADQRAEPLIPVRDLGDGQPEDLSKQQRPAYSDRALELT